VFAFFLGPGLLPQILFCILLAAGWYLGRLGGRQILTFLAVWLAGVLAAGLFPLMSPLFTAYVALIDVVLILVIFKGDIKI
jgi:hypothetical protein